MKTFRSNTWWWKTLRQTSWAKALLVLLKKACRDRQAFFFVFDLGRIQRIITFNMKYQLQTYSKKLLADTLTPVSVYLRIRDKFPNSLLLESSDYHSNDNSFSYICCNPIASITIENELITQQFPDGKKQISEVLKINPKDTSSNARSKSLSRTIG